MSETPVLLTATMASDCGFCIANRAFDPAEFGKELDALSAIASGQVACIEAERLARMEVALRRFVSMEDGPVYVAAPDIAAIAREALAAQEVK